MLGEDSASPKSPVVSPGRPPVKPGDRHYSAKGFGKSPLTPPAAQHTRFSSAISCIGGALQQGLPELSRRTLWSEHASRIGVSGGRETRHASPYR